MRNFNSSNVQELWSMIERVFLRHEDDVEMRGAVRCAWDCWRLHFCTEHSQSLTLINVSWAIWARPKNTWIGNQNIERRKSLRLMMGHCLNLLGYLIDLFKKLSVLSLLSVFENCLKIEHSNNGFKSSVSFSDSRATSYSAVKFYK